MNGNEKVCAALARDLRPARKFHIVVAITNHDRRVSRHSVEIVVELTRNAQGDVLLLQFAVVAYAAGILTAVARRNCHHDIAALIGSSLWFFLRCGRGPSNFSLPRCTPVDGICVIEVNHESVAKFSIGLKGKTFRRCFGVQINHYPEQSSVTRRTA